MKAGLWPLDRAIMEVEDKYPSTPPPNLPIQIPGTLPTFTTFTLDAQHFEQCGMEM